MNAKDRSIIVECLNKNCELYGLKLTDTVPVDTVYFSATCFNCGASILINILELDGGKNGD